MQPRRRRPPTCSTPTATAASTGCRSACSRWSPHVLAALGRTHDPANVAAVRRRWRAPPASTRSTSTSSTAAAGEIARRLVRARSTTSIALDPPHVERLRAHRRAGHAARRRPGPPPRRRRPGRQVPRSPPSASARPGSTGTRSRTGRGPATSAATTSSTGRRASTSGVGCAAHSHRDGRRFWNVRTPERYIDAVEQGARREAADERLDADGRAPRGPAARPPHRRRRARPTRSTPPTSSGSTGLRRGRRRPGPPHPSAVASSPTRSPSASADPRPFLRAFVSILETDARRNEAFVMGPLVEEWDTDLRSGDPLDFPGLRGRR